MKRACGRFASRGIAAGVGAMLCLGLIGLGGCARREAAGRIRVSGAWALYPMMLRWAEEFRKTHPEVPIQVSAGGASKGAQDVLAGRVEIGMVSRDIRPEELAQGAFCIPVVQDAVFATVNAANPAASALARHGVPRDTFIALWTGSKPMTWGEVSGNRKIKDRVRVYTRSDSCGAAETWAKYLGVEPADLRGLGVYGDRRLLNAVKSDRLAIGFDNLAYTYDARTGKPYAGLRVVPIDINGDARLDESEDFYGTLAQVREAIARGAYPEPLRREVYLMTKGKPTGLVREFIEWILGEGQGLVEQAGYVRLPQERLEQAARQLR